MATWMCFETDAVTLGELVAAFPELVTGRHVVVATQGSTRYKPTPADEKLGWIEHGDIAVSPKLKSVETLPVPDGYVEWYVRDTAEPFELPHRFVNVDHWTLVPPAEHPVIHDADEAEEAGDDEMIHELQDALMDFVREQDVVTYLCQGEKLVLVTRDGGVAGRVHEMMGENVRAFG